MPSLRSRASASVAGKEPSRSNPSEKKESNLPSRNQNIFLISSGLMNILFVLQIFLKSGSVDDVRALRADSVACAGAASSFADVKSSALRSVVEQSGTPQSQKLPSPAVNSNQRKVGSDGGAWTAETHLSVYGFNPDWGLMEVLEDAVREIENTHNTEDSQWHQAQHSDPLHPLNGMWKPPKVVDAKVLEVGCGVGVYVDALKKESAKKNRKVFGIEPNPMGGVFLRKKGPKQLAVNFLEQGDTFAYATELRQKNLHGDYFDLIYSIEVFEHMPMDRHVDAARFLSGLARPGTKLIFGAATPGQAGRGHIGNRKKSEWEQILKDVGFHKDVAATAKAQQQMQEFNHRKNTQVYMFRGVGAVGSLVTEA